MRSASILFIAFDRLNARWKQQVLEMVINLFGGDVEKQRAALDHIWPRCLDALLLSKTEEMLAEIRALVPPTCNN